MIDSLLGKLASSIAFLRKWTRIEVGCEFLKINKNVHGTHLGSPSEFTKPNEKSPLGFLDARLNTFWLRLLIPPNWNAQKIARPSDLCWLECFSIGFDKLNLATRMPACRFRNGHFVRATAPLADERTNRGSRLLKAPRSQPVDFAPFMPSASLESINWLCRISPNHRQFKPTFNTTTLIEIYHHVGRGKANHHRNS